MTAGTGAFSSCSWCPTPLTAVRPWRCCQRKDPLGNELGGLSCYCTRPPPDGRCRLPKDSFGGHGVQVRHLSFVQRLLVSVACALLLLCQAAGAREFDALGSVDIRRELLFDTGAAPMPRIMVEARQESSISSVSTAASTVTSTTSGSVTASTAAAATTTSLPRPFDTNLGNNFTSSTCPDFFHSFLTNQTFLDCLPFSLLLESSNGFFQALRSLPELTLTLDATCNVNFTLCSNYMAALARDISSDNACGQDLSLQNPQAVQAHTGLVAYAPLYHAGCLTDAGSGAYCFANAVTNASSPTSSYIYYLPLGIALPSNAAPACDACLQDTMAVFAEAASNGSQPLSGDYLAAAKQLDASCGATFVDAAVVATSGASLRLSSTPGPLTAPILPFFVPTLILLASWVWA